MLNAALSGQQMLGNYRDRQIQKLKDKHAGQSMGGVTRDDKDGVWRTADNEIATFVNRDKVEQLTGWDKFGEDILGWHSGIVEMQDGKVVKTEGSND